MNRGDKFAGYKAEKYAWREVVFADAMTKVEVIVEHSTKRERYRLCMLDLTKSGGGSICTFRYMYDVGGVIVPGEINAIDWVSRSSKRMPPGSS